MIRDMCDQFLDTEVLPFWNGSITWNQGLMRSLMEKAGEQGLLAVSFPKNMAAWVKILLPPPSSMNTWAPVIRFR